jgi:hypothetical protein
MAVFYTFCFVLGAMSPGFFYLTTAMIVGLWCIATFGYALPNWRLSGTFRIDLFEDRLECSSPGPAFGESFLIALEDLARIVEHEDPGEGANSWYLLTTDGRRVHLSYNYGSPVRKIVGEIRRLRPDLEVVRT